jgi:hypothetical protein
MNLPLIITRFAILTGERDATSITEQISLQSARVLRKGARRPPPRPPVPENSWEIETQKRQLYSIEDSMIELLNIIWPKKEQICSVCEQHNARCLFVSIVWADDEHRPVWEFSRETLERMQAFHASWIMDLV